MGGDGTKASFSDISFRLSYRWAKLKSSLPAEPQNQQLVIQTLRARSNLQMKDLVVLLESIISYHKARIIVLEKTCPSTWWNASKVLYLGFLIFSYRALNFARQSTEDAKKMLCLNSTNLGISFPGLLIIVSGSLLLIEGHRGAYLKSKLSTKLNHPLSPPQVQSLTDFPVYPQLLPQPASGSTVSPTETPRKEAGLPAPSHLYTMSTL